MSIILGIDVGGSGIKGAPVEVETGEFTADRFRIPTPVKSTPKNVASVIAEIIAHFADELGDAPVGLTIPAPVKHGIVPFIANLHKSWVGVEAKKFFQDALGRDVTLVNDADAAGLAEVHFGAAKGHPGLVILTTLGTGIGSALLLDGRLAPNTELGHLELDGHVAERRAAASIRKREGLSMPQWAERLQAYYAHLEALFWPELFIVGGGVSRRADEFLPLLDLRTEIVAAQLRNKAGIIGAGHLAVAGG